MERTYDQNSAKTKAIITPYPLLSTVTENREFYTRADIEGVDRERRYQGLLGWPSTSYFKTYVNKNLILNCNINVDNINISENMYGLATPILQGKMRRKKPTVHSKYEKYLYLLQYQREKNLHIYMEFFYINDLILLHSKTGKTNLLSVKSLTSIGATSFIKALDEIKTKHETIGFKITDYYGDNEFNIKTLETSLLTGLPHIYEKIQTRWNDLTFNMYNQGARKINISRSTIKNIHKSNENITNRGSREKVPIQRLSV